MAPHVPALGRVPTISCSVADGIFRKNQDRAVVRGRGEVWDRWRNPVTVWTAILSPYGICYNKLGGELTLCSQQKEGERESSLARATDGYGKLDGHHLCCRAAVDFILSGHVCLENGNFKTAEVQKLKLYEFVWGEKLKLIGLRLGFSGIVCLNLLFLPVARGSVLLRSIDIPFEHATKYHVWLDHFMMAVFTLHGLFYMVAWYFEGHLIQMILEWKPHEIANLPGLIALLAGIVMWVTRSGMKYHA